MKKIIFLNVFAVLLILGSCKNQNEEKLPISEEIEVENAETAISHSDVLANLDVILSNDWVDEIELDNDSRWDANPETTEGVENMLHLIKETQTKTLEDYHHLGSKLNDEKNYIIKECTMEGPSHDNLHVFLHPLIDKVDALLNSKSTIEAEKIVESMEANLQKYYDYFD